MKPESDAVRLTKPHTANPDAFYCSACFHYHKARTRVCMGCGCRFVETVAEFEALVKRRIAEYALRQQMLEGTLE